MYMNKVFVLCSFTPLLFSACFDLPYNHILESAKHQPLNTKTKPKQQNQKNKKGRKKMDVVTHVWTRGDELKSVNEGGFKCFLI